MARLHLLLGAISALGAVPTPGSDALLSMSQALASTARLQQDEAAPAPEPAAPGRDSPTEGISVETDLPALIEAHNRIRQEHDLPPLRIADKLAEAARVHAVDMAANTFLAHEGSDGSTPAERIAEQAYPYRKVAENVAEAYPSVDAVMEGWMESPGHRENILGDFEEIGAARARDAEGRPYWTVAFATPWPKLDPEEASQALVDAINARRQDAGKEPLRVDLRLQSVATRHAQRIAEGGETGRDGTGEGNPLEEVASQGYRYGALAMAGASGQPSAADVVATWAEQDDPPVDLLGDFQDAGAGYATDESGRPFWTLILGQPLGP